MNPSAASTTRALLFLIRLSFQRQARAHLMVWIALGLLGLTILIVAVNMQIGRFSMANWRYPRGQGPTFGALIDNVGFISALPWQAPANSGPQMIHAAFHTAVHRASGFGVFSEFVVFQMFTTFLLPLWSTAFATEGLGREREANNLLWVLTRPIPRPAIFLAKYVALLPWCLLLNLGGFTLICLAGGAHGRTALSVYWPAVFWSTLAFSALFHLFGACLRRAAIIALLYAFFLETIMGNLPGHFKRLSISFYARCLMYDGGREFGIHPQQPEIFQAVSGTTAWLVLAGFTVACLIVGAIVFARNEFLDVN